MLLTRVEKFGAAIAVVVVAVAAIVVVAVVVVAAAVVVVIVKFVTAVVGSGVDITLDSWCIL